MERLFWIVVFLIMLVVSVTVVCWLASYKETNDEKLVRIAKWISRA